MQNSDTSMCIRLKTIHAIAMLEILIVYGLRYAASSDIP